MDDRFIGYKIQLYPTLEQITMINRYFGAMRYVYNFAIDIQEKSLQESNKLMSQFSLNNYFTEFKNNDENSWLLDFDSTTMKIALWDAIKAFKMYLSHNCSYPKYKSRKAVSQSAALRGDRITITDSYVKLSRKLGKIACGHIPNNYCIGKSSVPKDDIRHREYYNPRLTFDGINYYLSFTMKLDKDNGIVINSYSKNQNNINQSDIIGIDLGCSKNNWIVDSNGNRISLPNADKEVKKIKQLQTKLNRQYRENASRLKMRNEIRTKNMEKTISKINKYYKKIYNRKMDIIHNYVSHELIEKNPQMVVLEDLTVSDMLLDRTSKLPYRARCAFNNNILDHCLYRVQEIIEYKCEFNNIPIIYADSLYPSSNRCSSCGSIHNIGSRKTYKCPICGNIMNRDLNAAKNLAAYPYLRDIEISVA